MTDELELLDKILDRYGSLGGLIFVIALAVLFFAWLFLSFIYPAVIFAPVLILGWMIWSVKGGKDE